MPPVHFERDHFDYRYGESDPHVSCLDTFSLAPIIDGPGRVEGPCEAFCQVQEKSDSSKTSASLVQMLPGLDVLDLYDTSEETQLWKDGKTCACIVPKSVVGWEFYTLLWPQPNGAAPLRLGSSIELMIGRPPGSTTCPSLIFAYVPAGQAYVNISTSGNSPRSPMAVKNRAGSAAVMQQRVLKSALRTPSGAGDLGLRATAMHRERIAGNLDFNSKTVAARVVALCPAATYHNANVLPDASHWGLFVGPRNRTLMLLNRHSGRIDLHLAVLFTLDAVFHGSKGLIDAFARLFEPLGTQNQLPALFANFDPLKTHCGLTNAVQADHVSNKVDGREDYMHFLGAQSDLFFLSNSSDNLRFLTPLEGQQIRSSQAIRLPPPPHLSSLPQWTLAGRFEESDRDGLLEYRSRIRPYPLTHSQAHRRTGLLHMFGLVDGEAWSMMSALGGCSEVSFAPGAAGARSAGGRQGGAPPAQHQTAVYDNNMYATRPP